MGQLKMTEEEFGKMGVPAFFLKLFYHRQQTIERMRFDAELARLQIFHLINIQLAPNDKFSTPQDMYRYSWEQNEVATAPQDPAELAKLVEKANAILNGI